MAFEKYGFLDAKVKEALVAHRKDPVKYHAELTDLIAARISELEELLMSKTLTYEEIFDLQEELDNLRQGKIDEPIEKQKNELLNVSPHRELTRKSFRSSEIVSHNEKTPHPPKPEKTEEVFTFDDMRLKAEDRLSLEPPSILTHERFIVKVIGYLKGGSIIVTSPIGSNGLQVPLREKDKVVIRSFSGENAFAFVSTILRINNLSFEYLHLSIPESIQGVKVRKVTRIKTNIITSALNSKNAESERKSVIISDICENGASLIAKQPLGDKGDILLLAFRVHLHNVEAFLSIKGVIRALISEDEKSESTKSDFVQHGIEFQDLQANDNVALQSMIYQQMIENPRSVM
jgi:hypothetical protein